MAYGTTRLEKKKNIWPSENYDFPFYCCRAPCIYFIKPSYTNIFYLLWDICLPVYAPNTHIYGKWNSQRTVMFFLFSFLLFTTHSFRGKTALFLTCVCIFSHRLLVSNQQFSIQHQAWYLREKHFWTKTGEKRTHTHTQSLLKSKWKSLVQSASVCWSVAWVLASICTLYNTIIFCLFAFALTWFCPKFVCHLSSCFRNFI